MPKPVNAGLAGTLAQNTEADCGHYGHEHSEGHTCDDHGCGHH